MSASSRLLTYATVLRSSRLPSFEQFAIAQTKNFFFENSILSYKLIFILGRKNVEKITDKKTRPYDWSHPTTIPPKQSKQPRTSFPSAIVGNQPDIVYRPPSRPTSKAKQKKTCSSIDTCTYNNDKKTDYRRSAPKYHVVTDVSHVHATIDVYLSTLEPESDVALKQLFSGVKAQQALNTVA